ncbi:PP2C-like domain-containing protein CG9801 isoform X2 [Littorina saxatilis]
MERGAKKIKFGQEIFYGATPDDVPYVQLSSLDDDVIVSYTGPDDGLMFAEASTENNGNPGPCAGCKTWSRKEPQAYGICISLYEQHPISMKMSGEPIADSFAICARKNNTILLIADGVNWGEKSRLAARCALYGSMKYLNYKMFDKRQQPATTQDAMTLLRKALDEAHRAILARDGGLTTMCACMIAPVENSDQHAVCCVNVGDSYGFVYSNNQGIREVTIGSHDVSSERDIRDAGGALGPVDGQNPELHNLTCSVTFCNKGDIVFLTTDGVSDNFDPVVTKIAIPQKADETNFNKIEENNPNGSFLIERPEMSPKERHVYSMKEMERVIHEYELLTEEMCSAQEFCSAMVQHVLTVTDGKRKVLENPALYAKRKMTSSDRKRRDTEIVDKMSKAPGKLDHASIVAVEIGGFVSLEEEKQSKSFELDNATRISDNSAPNTLPGLTSPTSPLSPSITPKKSGARKLLSKLKNLPSPTSSSTSSPSSPQPHHHGVKSPSLNINRPQSPLALSLSPRKFLKHGRSRLSSEPETPASPTIPESPFETGEDLGLGLVQSQS